MTDAYVCSSREGTDYYPISEKGKEFFSHFIAFSDIHPYPGWYGFMSDYEHSTNPDSWANQSGIKFRELVLVRVQTRNLNDINEDQK